eukprot:TRINITY_DN5594_c0_g1_i4.p1 TRINITY_DN5594_c0_g1~~TRINITY_DN5594_c0_g1_i4.p1  ORF type:complete len:533 (+),score=102.78 TRINITY_DN5594_c0_g1_i4:52-1650(+)
MASQAQYKNGFHKPQMPWFEPSTEPSAKASFLSQTMSADEHCTFPADRDFWNNFVTQVNVYPGAMDPPQYHVDASHTNESVLVNQEFLRRFVSGWERANPHVVTLSGPMGTTQVHTSEEFWNRFVTLAGQRSRVRAANGELGLEDVTVESSLLPMNPVKTTQGDWNEICQSWEQEKGTAGGGGGQPPPNFSAPPPQQQVVQQPPPQPVVIQHQQPQPIYDDGLLQQQNVQLDSQRQQLTSQNTQLENQRRQIEELRSQLGQVTHQSSLNNTAIADELRRAQAEAARYQQEADQLRSSQTRLQGEKDSLEQRIRALEKSLGGIQGEVARNKEQSARELASREKELAEVRQAADVADLKKELQMRELMQEELYRAKEEAKAEADEKCRLDNLSRQQEEICNMRAMIRDGYGRPNCPPQGGLCGMPPHFRGGGHMRALPPGPQHVSYCGQRTVATQTLPKSFSGSPDMMYGRGGAMGFPAICPPGHSPMHGTTPVSELPPMQQGMPPPPPGVGVPNGIPPQSIHRSFNSTPGVGW